MNRVSIIFVLLALICFAAIQTSAQKESRTRRMEQELTQINKAVDEAFLRSDVKELDRRIGDECIFIGRDGSVGNKSEVLQIFGSATIKFSEIKAAVETVRFYENIAVVTGQARTKGRRFEQEIDHLVRYTRVYAKQKGGWKLVSEQVTRIEE